MKSPTSIFEQNQVEIWRKKNFLPVLKRNAPRPINRFFRIICQITASKTNNASCLAAIKHKLDCTLFCSNSDTPPCYTAFELLTCLISIFFSPQVNHDLNTLKRLLRQAETDHYALYRQVSNNDIIKILYFCCGVEYEAGRGGEGGKTTCPNITSNLSWLSCPLPVRCELQD